MGADDAADIWIRSSGVYPVGEALACATELIAAGGVALAGLAAPSTGSSTGETLAGTLAEVGRAFQDVCLDLVEGASRLGALVDDTVRCYLSVDSDAVYRFGRVAADG